MLTIPELGDAIHTSREMLTERIQLTGTPKWPSLKVEVQRMPFNSKSYTAYAQFKRQANQINTIPFNDSLKFKPKFIRVSLADKIELTEHLNAAANTSVRDYLIADDGYKIVTQMDLALSEDKISRFMSAEAIQLVRDDYGSQKLVLINGNQKESYSFSELQVFDFDLSSICWGEDTYHNKKVKNLIKQGERCPKGTFLKPKKMEKTKPYLKL